MIYSIILMLCFRTIPGFGEWETCGPADVFSYGLCSISENSVLFSLVACPGNDEIYRSTDSGSTWSFCSITDFQCRFLISDSFNRVIAGGGSSVLISSDMGNNWTEYSTVSNTQCNSIASDPSDSLRLLGTVTESNGPLIESTDGGQTWQTLELYPEVSGYGVAFCSENPDVVYLAGRNNENSHLVVLKSNDGGSNWEDVTPLSISINPEPALTIAVSEDPDRALLALHSKVYATSNGGESWQLELETTSYVYHMEFIDSQGSALAVQHTKFYSTDDYGETWTTHLDVPGHSLAFASGTGGKIHIASYSGLYSADSPAGPWAETNTGIHGGRFETLAENHFDPSGFPVFTGRHFLNEEQYSFETTGLYPYVTVSHARRGTADPDLLFVTGNPG